MKDISTIFGIGMVKAVTATMSLGTTLAATWIFEPTQFGRIAFVWSLAAVLTVVVDFGSTIQLRKNGAEVNRDPLNWRTRLGQILTEFVIRSTAIAALLAVLILWLGTENHSLVLLLSVPIAFGFILELLLSEVFRARQNYFWAEVFTGGFRQAVYACALIAAFLHSSSVVALLSVFAALLVVACFFVVAKTAHPNLHKPDLNGPSLKQLLAFSGGEQGRFFLIGALVMVAQQLPVLAASAISGDETAAIVRVSLLFGVLMQFAVAANAMYFAPKIAATDKNDKEALALLARRSSRIGFVFIPAGLTAVAVLPHVVGPIFGSAYNSSVLGAQILIMTHTLTSIVGAYPQMLLLSGFDRTLLEAASLALLVQLTLIVVLAPLFLTNVYAVALGASLLTSVGYIVVAGRHNSRISAGPFAGSK